MSKNINHLWYASYGSNILESRFHCYILGGQPKGSKKVNPGCSDKTLPKDKKAIQINRQLYFAKQSKGWDNGGVGFINTEAGLQNSTLGRMYLITSEQFIEIVKQENDLEGELSIDFKKVREKGSLILRKESLYGNLIYLGEQDGSPIFTFTNEINLTQDINPPSEQYLSTIIKGLKETYDLNDREIKAYFRSLPGVKDHAIEKKLNDLIEAK